VLETLIGSKGPLNYVKRHFALFKTSFLPTAHFTASQVCSQLVIEIRFTVRIENLAKDGIVHTHTVVKHDQEVITVNPRYNGRIGVTGFPLSPMSALQD
jgi:hypothetical protein